MRVWLFAEKGLESSLLRAYPPKRRTRLSVGISGSLRKALSTALWFSLAMRTFLFLVTSWAVISAMTSVLPVPGGPLIRNIPLEATAFLIASFCFSLSLLL